jgi:hypothetical protein
MAITPLPTPPSRDDPTNFATRADAFLGALPDFATEANALQTDVNAKEVTASNAATTATTQAGIATTQAGIATTQAGIATTQAGDALASANSAAASFDSFDDRYLGAKSSDPTVDNDGNALLVGALYFNSVVGEMRVWSGTAWAAAYLPEGSYITLNGTQTLTNKTVEAGTFTNGYTEEVATANTSTAYTIDLANGSVQILTLTGNCTFTFPTATAGQSFILLLKQDGTGGRTVTWPASVEWPGGTAPTITSTASKMDKLVFTAADSNWYGSVAGQSYTV